MTTSEPRECFVFIHLPSGAQVVCGRFVQEPIAGGGWRGRFVYARTYRQRKDAVAIDPFELPLEARTFEIADQHGIFGALRDASPDAWGRRVIEWRLGGGGLRSEIDYLLHSPEDRAGALSFATDSETPPTVQRYNRIIDLDTLQSLAQTIDAGDVGRESTPVRQVQQLLEPGTSMGGARPKNVVQDEDGLWLAKFGLRGDRWNVSVVEGAMLRLAALCGIRVAEHKTLQVAGQSVLLVKRFDRARRADGTWLRARMVSAKTVLRANDGVTDRAAWSYLRLADELQRWVEDAMTAKRELFRRMIFNALISNTDDHPRNHALIAPSTAWQLSPAYDLTPTPASSSERDLALEVGNSGRRANRTNLLSECLRFGFEPHEAARVIDEMKQLVSSRWAETIKSEGGTQADVDAVARAFDYPGFEFAAEI